MMADAVRRIAPLIARPALLALVAVGAVAASFDPFTFANYLSYTLVGSIVARSTLLVAALFNPLRVRVQRVVDRRFNRARYDAEGTVRSSAARLRGDLDLGAVSAEIVGTATSAVRPTTAGVWLRRGSR